MTTHDTGRPEVAERDRMGEALRYSTHSDQRDTPGKLAGRANHGGHGWMMIAWCIPMVLIAVALVATSVVSAGFLVLAVVCTAMMALMMLGMHGSSGTH